MSNVEVCGLSGNLDFNGRGIVCVFYDWEERCWVRGASYYRGEETHFMYADDWEKYEAQRLLLEESMRFVTLEDDTAKLLFDYENNREEERSHKAWAEELIRRFNGEQLTD